MVDIVDPVTRSRMMSGIRAKDTKPEMQIRSALHRRGFRFRLNYAGLPGKPDLVLKKYNAVIFVHGCFWHRHDCALFKWPSSKREFWKKKLSQNHARDIANIAEISRLGWRIATIWECSLKGRERWPIDKIADIIARWLENNKSQRLEIQGKGIG